MVKATVKANTPGDEFCEAAEGLLAEMDHAEAGGVSVGPFRFAIREAVRQVGIFREAVDATVSAAVVAGTAGEQWQAYAADRGWDVP
jgi:hypothetical protein